MTIVINYIGDNCPVQAEGTVDGEPFYFRARHQRWSMSIGGDDVIGSPTWYYEESYGENPQDAGWMSEDEARIFIEKSANLWISKKSQNIK